jgi:hypothetical protein
MRVRFCLQPIGIGKKMSFRIGQRKRLSDIDVAQLNALYSCYAKEAQKTGQLYLRCGLVYMEVISSVGELGLRSLRDYIT